MKRSSFIQKKMFWMGLAFTFIVIVGSLLSFVFLNKVKDNALMLKRHPLQITKLCYEVNSQFLEIDEELHFLSEMQTSTPVLEDSLFGEINQSLDEINRRLPIIKKFYLGPESDFTQLNDGFNVTKDLVNQINVLLEKNNETNIRLIISRSSTEVFNQNISNLKVIIDFTHHKSEELVENTLISYDRAIMVYSFGILIGLLLIFILYLYTNSNIVNPLSDAILKLQRIMVFEGENGVDSELLNKRYWNEIEILTQSVKRLSNEIDQRKQIEEVNEKQKILLDEIVDQSIQGIITIDEKGLIQSVNKRMLVLFEYDREELIGENVAILMDSEDKKNHSNYLKYGSKKESINPSIVRPGLTGRKKSGKLFMVDINLMKHMSDTKIMYTGFIKDLSLENEKEQLLINQKASEKALLFRNKFLANMSHEIRTPLNGIIGINDVLLNDEHLNDEQKEYLGIVKASSKALLSIVNDILDFSKIEAGQMRMLPVEANINHVVKRSELLFNEKANNKGIILKHKFEHELPRSLMFDENRVSQILSNFLSNAIKYSEEGRVTTIVDSENHSEDSFLVRVKVIDEGHGISVEDQERIFSEFEQLNDGIAIGSEGTGLGLSICKNIAGLLGGEVGVISEPGVGSEFYFTFLAKKVKVSSSTIFYHEKTEDKKVYDINILLVDDKEINRKVTSLMLDMFSCKVQTASNGLEAIELIKNTKYDLILMDIQMPIMDGVTATKEIRNFEKEKNIIIGLSANAMEGDAERYVAEGMDDYLPKPITADVLSKMLRKWF